ncbi:ParB N-terminal domain-containing protein [Nocardioides zeae]|uniref:ParB N-terminal domain-containing protein n=1 Tax=Nocardioides zeae TaxID=1457234 RepID=UPI0037CB034E
MGPRLLPPRYAPRCVAREPYELIMGERRWRPTQEAGLDQRRCLVAAVDRGSDPRHPCGPGPTVHQADQSSRMRSALM